jgi:hypothetical protein
MVPHKSSASILLLLSCFVVGTLAVSVFQVPVETTLKVGGNPVEAQVPTMQCNG